jgi:integrase/recombinase XerD
MPDADQSNETTQAPAPAYDVCGRRRSSATLPEARRGQLPGNFGKRYPAEVYSPDEVLAVMRACGRHPAGVRDRALIAVLWRTGMRINEALSLELKDLQPNTQTIRIRKGKSPGTVAMEDWGWIELRRWLDLRASYPPGPLFCVVEGPTKGRSALGASSFRTKLQELASKGGVTRRIHPHGFRHSLAAELHYDGVGLLHIQRQLRHRTLAYTAGYLTGIAPADTVNIIRARKPAWQEEGAAA